MDRVERDEVLALARRADAGGQKELSGLLLMVAGMIDDRGRTVVHREADDALSRLLSIGGPFGVGYARMIGV